MGLRLTKVATPSSPSANLLDLFYDTTLAKPCAIDESGNVAVLGGFATKDFRIIRVLNYTSGNNVYTPTAGTKAIFVECWGGGAGGAGVANSANAAQTTVGCSGGGGSYAAAWLTGTLPSAGTTYDANVGASANGGSGAANGTAGNDTTFRETTGPTNKCIGKGGSLGATANGLATAATLTYTGACGAGGVAGTGDVTIVGGEGKRGMRLSTVASEGGIGGDCPRGGAGGLGGVIVGTGTKADGSAGAQPGGGGGGGVNCNSATATSGGAGAAGLIRIWEWA
jgi:hypothetical protein